MKRAYITLDGTTATIELYGRTSEECAEGIRKNGWLKWRFRYEEGSRRKHWYLVADLSLPPYMNRQGKTIIWAWVSLFWEDDFYVYCRIGKDSEYSSSNTYAKVIAAWDKMPSDTEFIYEEFLGKPRAVGYKRSFVELMEILFDVYGNGHFSEEEMKYIDLWQKWEFPKDFINYAYDCVVIAGSRFYRDRISILTHMTKIMKAWKRAGYKSILDIPAGRWDLI